MARYVTTATTTMTPTQAFAYMADVHNFERWDPGIVQVQQVSGEQPGPDAAYDLTVEAGGRTVMRYQVVAYEPPTRLLLRARTTFFTSVDEVRVEAGPSGTTVTYDAELTLNGPLKLLDPALSVAFKRIGDRAAEGLRRELGAARVAS